MPRSADEIYNELLVLRCQRRDPNAWRELIDRYHDRLYYFVRRLVDDDEHAMHLMQDVWLMALRGIGSLQDASRFAPWIYTIARRAVMSSLRLHYRNREQTVTEPTEPAKPDEANETLAFENAELNVKEHLLRIELQLAESSRQP